MGKAIIIRSRIVGHAEVPPEQLLANPKNFRRHPGEQMDALRGSLNELGWFRSVLVNKRTGHILDGHARIEEAMRQAAKFVPVEYVDVAEEEEGSVLLIHDPMAEMAKRDEETFQGILAEAHAADEGLNLYFANLAGEEKPPEVLRVEEIDALDVSEDRFFLSVHGPLPQQMDALEHLKAALSALPGVEVEVGTSR